MEKTLTQLYDEWQKQVFDSGLLYTPGKECIDKLSEMYKKSELYERLYTIKEPKMRQETFIYCQAPGCSVRESAIYDTEIHGDVQQAILKRKSELGWIDNKCPLHISTPALQLPIYSRNTNEAILVQLTRIADALELSNKRMEGIGQALELLTAPSMEQAVANHQLAMADSLREESSFMCSDCKQETLTSNQRFRPHENGFSAICVKCSDRLFMSKIMRA